MSRPVFLDARRDLLSSLIDYAGLFPPASLPLEAAVAEYRAARAGPSAWLLGMFVINASQLEELAGALVASMTKGEDPWAISVILDGDQKSAVSKAQAFDTEMGTAARLLGAEALLPASVLGGMLSEATEAARPTYLAATSTSPEAKAYLEVPAAGTSPRDIGVAVGAIAVLGTEMRKAAGAKLRCGGLAPDLIPAPENVAAFVVACRDSGLAFKATAGLHHPVRHFDPELGATRHGFLNLLVATALAEDGASPDVLVAAIAEEDPSAFTVGASGVGWKGHHVAGSAIEAMRATRFASYGSCSFDEPIEDLEALGMLEPLSA